MISNHWLNIENWILILIILLLILLFDLLIGKCVLDYKSEFFFLSLSI